MTQNATFERGPKQDFLITFLEKLVRLTILNIKGRLQL